MPGRRGCGQGAPPGPPLDRWACPACSEPNRGERATCNNCRAPRPLAASDAASGGADGPDSEESPGGGAPPPAAPIRSTGSVLDQRRQEILAAVAGERVTIIVAPTGCGKSTGIPQMLLDEVGAEGPRRILCTQPRRIAATSLARRVSEHREAPLGAEVGYQIGGCNEVSRSGRTKLIYAVTAIAMIQCLQDCATFTHLLVDEVHIRDSFIDFLLTLVVTKVLKSNHKVKVVLMSAAMDSDTVANYFAGVLGKVPRPLDLESCRPYPLTVKYMDDFPFFKEKGLSRPRLTKEGFAEWHKGGVPADWSQEEMCNVIGEFVLEQHRTRATRQLDKGGPFSFESILVFLAGKREVTIVAERLEEEKLDDLSAKCVFGGQTVETQEQTLQGGDAASKRTVILATDVVESSVTIPDVDLVVDTCEHKRLRWDPSKRQSLLTLLLISQDEAKQRAGRTGRMRPGEVIRLLSKRCFASLRPHVEPQIRHSRLEDVLLTIFELPNLGDPREFLQKMPDPPAALRVDTAITRLLELNALDRSAAVEGGPRARPTHFGRFLQKMPLDPEVGCLVMNGARLLLVEECAVLAAVHQRGAPFMDSQEWAPGEVQALWRVRDACSPGRASGRTRPLPSDLVAGMRAFQAWQRKSKDMAARPGQPWAFDDEASWCAQHYLSLDRLHEIEEMVMQIREVLEELGYGESVPAEARKQLRMRRQAKAQAQAMRAQAQTSRAFVAPWFPAGDPAADLRQLLKPLENREVELLLCWCIAASFTAGIVEVHMGASAEQVKFRPKKATDMRDITGALRERGFGIIHDQRLGRGDCAVTFRSVDEAHRCLQEASLCNNRWVPWRTADPWGRPGQRAVQHPRKCYEGPPFRLISSSAATPVPSDEATVVAAEVLPCMDHKRTSMSYMATKCSVVPPGILPLVLCATYPATTHRVTHLQGQEVWRIATRIHGVQDEEDYFAPDDDVERALRTIRDKMDTEFGMPQAQRQSIAKERRALVLKLMRLLDTNGDPPMPPVHSEARNLEGGAGRSSQAPRRRGTRGGFDAAPLSFLSSLGQTDLSNFTL